MTVLRTIELALCILVGSAGYCQAGNVFEDLLRSLTPEEAGVATIIWPVEDLTAGAQFSWGPMSLNAWDQEMHLYVDLLLVDGNWGLGGSVESSNVIDLLRLEEWFPLPWHQLLDGTRTGACGWKEENAAFGLYLMKPLAQF